MSLSGLTGWPIAAGVIEGACRHLVQDRMGITGARWARKAPRPSTMISRAGRPGG